MPTISEETFAMYETDRKNLGLLVATCREVVQFLLAATKRGYTDAHQKDCLVTSLRLLTNNDKKTMEVLMNIPIVGRFDANKK